MRSFIAIEINNEQILAALEELRKVKADLRPVGEQNLHLTLKFLGEIQEGDVEKIHAAMCSAFDAFGAFEVSLRGIGVFPSLSYARVVWIGFEKGREKLIDMQRALDEELGKLGFGREKKFEPHLTIARVKSPLGKEELKKFVLARKESEFGSAAVEKIELKKSVLTPRGAIYTTLRECALRT